MKTVQLKNTHIPAIALGTWSWGTGANGGDSVFGNDLMTEDLQPVFDAAMNAGLNLWDTAAVYGMGASEAILKVHSRERQRSGLNQIHTPRRPVR